jgi:probable HAF family extracellular repeat protein
MKKHKLLNFICLLLLLSITESAIAVEYEYTELSGFGNGGVVCRINNKGDVVGGRFLYRDGEYTEILPFSPNASTGLIGGLRDINDNGVIVGSREVADEHVSCKGFIYKDGTYTNLSSLIPQLFSFLRKASFASFAERINNKGVVIGNRSQQGFPWSGFIYYNGVYKFLRIPLGWRNLLSVFPLGIVPNAINDRGVVVGDVWSYNNKLGYDTKGFIYYLGIYRWLLPPGYRTSSLTGINNNGMVVGYGEDGDNDLPTAFVYNSGKYTKLLPEGCEYSTAIDINDNGDIVGYGWSLDDNGTATIKAFIYSAGHYTELLPPGWESAYPTGINNSGVIVGRGLDTRVAYTWKTFMAVVPK